MLFAALHAEQDVLPNVADERELRMHKDKSSRTTQTGMQPAQRRRTQTRLMSDIANELACPKYTIEYRSSIICVMLLPI
jgi:hypothetical protein